MESYRMNKNKVKSEEIAKLTEAYLKNGGKITSIPLGNSTAVIRDNIIKALKAGDSVEKVSKKFDIDIVVIKHINNSL